METMNDLKDLLKHEIDDLYSVEEQILEALPGMIEKAGNQQLKNALTEHLRITEEHKNRLDKIQKKLNKGEEEGNEKRKGFLSGIFGGGKHVCKGMQGILEEGNKMLKADMTPEVMDAAIIACTQKVEHYEICGYGTARTYARELGMEQEAVLLEKTLNEEYEADDKLTAMAIQRINLEAEAGSAKGGESAASGSTKGRAGRDTTRERVRAGEMEMETVSRGRSSDKRSGDEGSGKPKGAAATRSSTPRTSRSSAGKSTKTSGGSSGSGSRASSTSVSRSSGTRGSSRGRS